MDDKLTNIFPALQLTDACNKNCTACLRSAYATRHRLSFKDVEAYLDDLRRLSRAYRIKYQFVTGGEPTIWKDGGKDIVDVLAAVNRLGLVSTLTMPTNGKVFEDIHAARDLVRRVSKQIEGAVVFGVSIAAYQGNLDDEGCKALENLLSVCGEPGMQVLPIALVTLSKEDDTGEQLSKRYPAVYQRVTPLAPMGKAAALRDDCPSLRLSNSDKSPLGSFLPYFKKDVASKLGLSDDDFATISNKTLMNLLSFFNNCGSSFFVKTGWHYCLPFLEDSRFEMSPIGQMAAEIPDRFLESNPFLQEIRKHGVIEAAARNRDALSSDAKDRLDAVLEGEIPVSVAYRGCMVCKQLADMGVMGPVGE
jgi:hypothetical protein